MNAYENNNKLDYELEYDDDCDLDYDVELPQANVGSVDKSGGTLYEVRRKLLEAFAIPSMALLFFLWDLLQRFDQDGYQPDRDFYTNNRYDQHLLTVGETCRETPRIIKDIIDKAQCFCDSTRALSRKDQEWFRTRFQGLNLRFRVIEDFLRDSPPELKKDKHLAHLQTLLKEYVALRGIIVCANEGLVRHSVNSQIRGSIQEADRDDLYSEARILAFELADRYCPAKGAFFSTYASRSIGWMVVSYFRKKYGESNDKPKKAKDKDQSETNNGKLKDATSQANSKKNAKKARPKTISLDETKDKNSKSLVGCIADRRNELPEDVVGRKELNEKVVRCVRPLLGDLNVLLFLEYHGLTAEDVNVDDIESLYDALWAKHGVVAYEIMAQSSPLLRGKLSSPQNVEQRGKRDRNAILKAIRREFPNLRDPRDTDSLSQAQA